MREHQLPTYLESDPYCEIKRMVTTVYHEHVGIGKPGRNQDMYCIRAL